MRRSGRAERYGDTHDGHSRSDTDVPAQRTVVSPLPYRRRTATIPERMTAPRSSRRAFTIVELLIVIGVIGVLVALLLPVLGRARESARRAGCISNLRQVHQTVQQYAFNHRGAVPLGYRAGFKQFNSMAYSATSRPPPEVSSQPGQFCLFGVLYLNKYMDPPDAFFCPSNDDPQSNFRSDANPWPPGPRGTGPNVYVGYGFRPQHEIKDEVQRDGGFVPKLSSFGVGALLADLTATPQRLDLRHRDGVNVLYGDGSGRWVPRSAFAEPLSKCPGISKDANPYQDQIWEILDKH